eukprot:UN30104
MKKTRLGEKYQATNIPTLVKDYSIPKNKEHVTGELRKEPLNLTNIEERIKIREVSRKRAQEIEDKRNSQQTLGLSWLYQTEMPAIIKRDPTETSKVTTSEIVQTGTSNTDTPTEMSKITVGEIVRTEISNNTDTSMETSKITVGEIVQTENLNNTDTLTEIQKKEIIVSEVVQTEHPNAEEKPQEK